MTDYYIKHFYDQVKDPSWPDVKNYNELINLPDKILDECNHIHELPTRLSQLEDTLYWKDELNLIGFQYKNLVYVPVAKCANSYYTNFFKQMLGWNQVYLRELDHNEVDMFGLIMNPMTRRVKGITQVLCNSYDNDYGSILDLLKSPRFAKFISLITMLEKHTMPYTMIFDDLLNKIHWIPMEPFTDIELKKQVTCFLGTKNINIVIPDDKRLNQSSEEKEKIFTLIQDIVLSLEPPAELGLIFASDVKFYNDLLKKYAQMYNNN